MEKPTASYYVTHPDETAGFSNGAGSYIPTIGAPTAVIDHYRTIGIHQTNYSQISMALVDVTSIIGLAKIAEGGISTYKDLLSAETALQALLLHDFVDVLTYGPKIRLDSGIISYLRGDRELRSRLGFELCMLAGSRDLLICPEYVVQENGIIISSTLVGSVLIGQKVDLLNDGVIRSPDYWNNHIQDKYISTAIEHRVPLYLSNESVSQRAGDGFEKNFYHLLKMSWDKSIAKVPPIVASLNLPPLLAIVLDRLNKREDLLTIIRDLRAELEPVRIELFEFNRMIDRSFDQTELERRSIRISEAFMGIIPESRMSSTEKLRRSVGKVFNVVKPLVNMFAASNEISLEKALELGANVDKILNSGHVVNRTVTSKTFAGLVKTDSIQALAKHHFTASELAAIEHSIRES